MLTRKSILFELFEDKDTFVGQQFLEVYPQIQG